MSKAVSAGYARTPFHSARKGKLTGGKTSLRGITKRGNTYLRYLFVHGARAVCRHRRCRPHRLGWWLPTSRFRGDMTIVRSSHGITAVRQRVCVSNDIAVHALEVDVQPGPAWAQVASESHARVSIVLDAIGGGRIESRLKRDHAPANGPVTMNFAPPG